MGEMNYTLNNESYVRFNEESDYGCLCTFPHNYEVMGYKLDVGTIASLALLGTAVAIAANKPSSINIKGAYGNICYIPECIPDWIKNEIDRILRL